jgi:hypothetical protein
MPQPWPPAANDLLRQIYELQSKSLTNWTYYAMRLRQVQQIAFWMEVVITAAASGALASALAKVANEGILQWLVLIAAVASIVRPIYAPSKRVEHLSKLVQGYLTNYFGLTRLGFAISQDGSVSEETRRRYETVFDRHIQLAAEDEPTHSKRLLDKAEAKTKEVLPADGFWWPEKPKESGGTDDNVTPISR